MIERLDINDARGLASMAGFGPILSKIYAVTRREQNPTAPV
jgi:hypothetical protein